MNLISHKWGFGDQRSFRNCASRTDAANIGMFKSLEMWPSLYHLLTSSLGSPLWSNIFSSGDTEVCRPAATCLVKVPVIERTKNSIIIITFTFASLERKEEENDLIASNEYIHSFSLKTVLNAGKYLDLTLTFWLKPGLCQLKSGSIYS